MYEINIEKSLFNTLERDAIMQLTMEYYVDRGVNNLCVSFSCDETA